MTTPEDCIDVIVEIPRGSRNKYEFDHDTHEIRLDRRLSTAMTYPADYGFVPDTWAEDNDPLDALVLVEDPTFPGCHIWSRPLGVFLMSDERGRDAKLICVPHNDRNWLGVTDLVELPPHRLDEIGHFFDVYKELEPGKSTTSEGFGGLEQAWAEIEAARLRWRDR